MANILDKEIEIGEGKVTKRYYKEGDREAGEKYLSPSKNLCLSTIVTKDLPTIYDDCKKYVK